MKYFLYKIYIKIFKKIYQLFKNKSEPINDVKKISEKDDFLNYSKDYQKYLSLQARKSFSLSILSDKSRIIESTRKESIFLARTLTKDWNLKIESILSIGCRDTREIKRIKKSFRNAKVNGIDLFSQNEEIIVADMHSIPFPNNSFNLVISIHSMEHSYNPKKAFGEIFRILNNKGMFVIEVPVCFELNDSDIQDYKNIEGLVSFFPKDLEYKIIYMKLQNRENVSRPPNLRVAFLKN